MASLELRNETFRVVFMYNGHKYSYSLKTSNREDAEALLGGVEKTLMRIEQRLLPVPDEVDIIEFVKNDGILPAKNSKTAEELTFAKFKEQYLETHRNGTMELSSLTTIEVHLGHFKNILGNNFVIQRLSLADLQKYVNERAKKKYRGKSLSPVTLKKEIASLRAAWNWAVHMGLVKGPFPNKGLVYPKHDEKPPFQTWAEIERKIPGLSEREQRDWWDCLFLTQNEITEFLNHVKTGATQPWVYSAICFAAHTGARRSEIIRVRLQDLDLEGSTVLIQEKKRAKGRRTTRRVPLSPFLAEVLKEWLNDHPGGQYLFCHESEVARSKKRSPTTGHKGEKTRAKSLKGRRATVQVRSERTGQEGITKDEAHDHFQRTIADSKWHVLKGWHVLRHSFISNCAAKGVDQRLIDAWVGHQTEEMRKRYRHLIPSAEQAAIRAVFE